MQSYPRTKDGGYVLLLRLRGAKGADSYEYAGFLAEAGDLCNGKGSGGNIAGLARAEKGGQLTQTTTN